MNAKIRPLRPEDRDAWIRLRLALWPDYPPQDIESECATYFNDAKIWTLPSAVFVAESERPNDLIGFIEVSLRPLAPAASSSPVGYIEGWYVQPQHHRTGVGRALIHAAESWARSKGVTSMASDCRATNDASRLAHLALGYQLAEPQLHFHKPLANTSPTTDWIALVPFDLSTANAIEAVTHPAAGGIDLFLGTTRAENHPTTGAPLIALDYEAYADMATQQLHDLAKRARAQFPILHLVLLHRTGRVPIAHPSVLIAVSTPHRAESFAATQWLIDTLKAEVAIWKKEIWSDGTGTWVHPAQTK